MDEANDGKKGVGCDQTKNNRKSCSIVRKTSLNFSHVHHEDLSAMTANAFCDQASCLLNYRSAPRVLPASPAEPGFAARHSLRL